MQPPDVVVGVLEEAGEHLHHARVEALLVGAQAVPRRDVGIARGQLRARAA